MTDPRQDKIIVGMSGGVDSSVAALLLLERGASVEGLFMKNWDEDDGTEYCTAKADYEDAAEVAHRLGIKLHTANFAAEYWDNVFENFLAEYRAGRTPNPDVLCNREIKFNVFIDYARSLGATAHRHRSLCAHSRSVRTDSNCTSRSIAEKDQTYFLNAVPLGQLSRRASFRSAILRSPMFARSRSAPVCTIISARTAPASASSVNDASATFWRATFRRRRDRSSESTAVVYGEHVGLHHYTIGQREGLGIGGRASRARGAVVCRIERHEGEHTGRFASAARSRQRLADHRVDQLARLSRRAAVCDAPQR